jgi:Xaa-Pro aminopeptidase
MIPYVDAQGLNKSLATVGSELVPVKENLIDRIWLDPPQAQAAPAFVLDEKYAGESHDSECEQSDGCQESLS